jgi:phospholipid/cholesterol/gamma-HCH transport system substrate-binding protein
MARHNPAELITGAVVLAVAGVFLLFAVANTGKSFGASGYDLHASFDHVDGLSNGTDVRIAGVKVGSIRSIVLDPKTYLADVTFSVQKDIALTQDSSATVSTDGLLGGKYLALATGGDDKMLKPGDAITITQGSINLETLLGKYIFGSTGKPAAGGDTKAAPSGGDAKAAPSGGDAKSAPSGGDGIAPLK